MRVTVKEIKKEGKSKFNTQYYIAVLENEKKETHECIVFKNDLKVGDVLNGEIVEYQTESGDKRKKFNIIKKKELLEEIYNKISTLEEKINELLKIKQ